MFKKMIVEILKFGKRLKTNKPTIFVGFKN